MMNTVQSTPAASSRVMRTARLPSAPGAAMRILSLCRQEEAQIYEIAEAIMLDPALSSRMLRYVNSASLGVGRQVTSIREAVLLMGLRSTELLALGFSLMSPDFKPSCPQFDTNRFWSESFLTATAARRMASMLTDVEREEAFVVGLLSRIGRLALACTSPQQYADVLQEVASGESLTQAEEQQFGVDHLQFGVRLLADWHFPEVLVNAMQHLASEPEKQDATPVLAEIVGVARVLAETLLNQAGAVELSEEACGAVSALLKCDDRTLLQVTRRILQDYREVAEVFELSIENQDAMMDLLSQAREEAIRIGMAAHREQARLSESHSVLLKQASTDPLTGIANRARFTEDLKRTLAESARAQSSFALILFDLDLFKDINDNHGHAAGDFVLRKVASVVREMLREVDLFARYGGEEFTVLLPGVDSYGACLVTERIRAKLENLELLFEGTPLSVTASFGLVWSGDYNSTLRPDQVTADADSQLYLSKSAGKNTWHFRGKPASTWRGRLKWNFLSKAMLRAFGRKSG